MRFPAWSVYPKIEFPKNFLQPLAGQYSNPLIRESIFLQPGQKTLSIFDRLRRLSNEPGRKRLVKEEP
jgi:hypothetical protein